MMAQQARQYAQRNREGSNWFSHDGDVAKPSGPAASEPAAAASEASAANDAGEVSADKSTTAEAAPHVAPPMSARAQMIRPKCDSNEWYKYDHGGSGEEGKSSSAATVAETKREKEGAVYCKRDKTGSADQWFSHDHVDNDVGQQRAKSASGGSANAARMRNESDCWYNYDKPATEEVTVQKKRGAGIKPGSNEMHGVFHHAKADN